MKALVKFLVAGIFYYSGAFYLLRTLNNLLGRRLTVVTYHRVADMSVDEIKWSLPYLFVTDKTFEKHLAFFKKHYRIITFQDIVTYGDNKHFPKNSLMVVSRV